MAVLIQRCFDPRERLGDPQNPAPVRTARLYFGEFGGMIKADEPVGERGRLSGGQDGKRRRLPIAANSSKNKRKG